MDYRTLDGKKLTAQVRRKNRSRVSWNIFYIFCLIAVMAAILIYNVLENHEYLMTIVVLLLCSFGIWALVSSIIKAVGVLRDVPNSRVFRKYGTPDEIAARIAEESGEPILRCRQTLLTRSFIMRTDEPQSYIPLEKAALIYRKEHRTNGIKDSVSLVVHDWYGDQFEYPFKLGKKHAAEMDLAANTIINAASACRVGYTPENLSYIRTNTQPVPEKQ